MYVQARPTRGSDNLKNLAGAQERPSNEVAREKIAAFREKLSTGQLDGAEEALAPRGPASRLKLG